MIYEITNPRGIDKEIQTIQGYLYNDLIDKWSTEIEGFGRAYKNRKDTNFIPEVYKGNGEYELAYFDDNYNGKMFFLEADDHTSEDGFKFRANIKICFMLNLDEIKPSTEFRRDADVQSDVVGVLNANPLPNLTITGIEKGLRNIFRGYRVDQIESTYDIHPLHAFAVTGELEYYLTEQCN